MIIGLALVLLLNSSWLIALLIVLGLLLFFVVNLIMRQESMLYVPCVMPGMQTPGAVRLSSTADGQATTRRA